MLNDQREIAMDELNTLSDAELNRAQITSLGDDELAEDCYQIVRYRRGAIFDRARAERGLRKIREMVRI